MVACWLHFKVVLGSVASHKRKHDYCRLDRNIFLGKTKGILPIFHSLAWVPKDF